MKAAIKTFDLAGRQFTVVLMDEEEFRTRMTALEPFAAESGVDMAAVRTKGYIIVTHGASTQWIYTEHNVPATSHIALVQRGLANRMMESSPNGVIANADGTSVFFGNVLAELKKAQDETLTQLMPEERELAMRYSSELYAAIAPGGVLAEDVRFTLYQPVLDRLVAELIARGANTISVNEWASQVRSSLESVWRLNPPEVRAAQFNGPDYLFRVVGLGVLALCRPPTLREFADGLKSGNPLQVPLTHKPTANELNNVLYLFMVRIGFPMREVDLAAVNLMGGPVESIAQMDKWIKAAAEYIWDHWMGEPQDVSVEDLEYLCAVVRDELFAMDEATRNSIEAT